MEAVLRAYFGYVLLVAVLRIVGRRPGRQLTPFEYVLIFFIGGLALTGIVGDEHSLTNAICQVLAIAAAHFTLVWCRTKSSRIARLTDGTPLVLMDRGRWRSFTLKQMSISSEDVMTAARDHQHHKLAELERAVLERNGEISVLPATSGAAQTER